MKNIELKPRENLAVISVNPKVFALEVIYAAAYVLLDKAYFILDGDPEEEIKVTMKPKKKMQKNEIEELALKFYDELINYSMYVVQAARNQAVREAIIKRAFATNLAGDIAAERNSYSKGYSHTLKEKAEEIKMKEENLYIDDPKGIAKPWTPEKAKGLKNPFKSEKNECK